MLQQLHLDNVVLVRKRVKYLRLSVHPPIGEVRISAPVRMSAETIRQFVASKQGWIRRQQEQLQSRPPHVPCAYRDDETHMVWGRKRVLELVAHAGKPFVELNDQTLLLHIHPESSAGEREALVRAWHGTLLQAAAPALVAKWEPLLGVAVAQVSVRHMTTRWGSCTPRSRRIRLSTELAKKPPACLEYVVVHEMVHLLEASHNRRFARLMDRFMPDWRLLRRALVTSNF